VAVATTTLAAAVLLARTGSVVVDVTDTELLIKVPDATPALTFTTSGNDTGDHAVGARLAIVQVIVPVPPTAGRVPQFQPVGTVNDWNVVLAGMVSVQTTVAAELGPLLARVCV
jgi:hypothetical protein